MSSEQPHGPVLGLAYAVAEVAQVPVDQIAGYIVLVVNLDGHVGTVAAGLSHDEQMQACAAAISRFSVSSVPDAVIIDGD